MAGSVFHNAKKLGFGLMRLPRKGEEIDIDQTAQMVDRFMLNGFTYFDTAYVYKGSEEAARCALLERYPRDSFTVADKLPLDRADSPTKLQELTETSLSRLGTDYFDYYLLHGLHDAKSADALDAWAYIKRLKADGIARHIGFSYHGSPETLDDMLELHPETEFVQLQVNYLDWDDPRIASRRCLEAAAKHGVPVIVMEPVKGGALAALNDACAAPLKALSEASLASYAIRFAASRPGVEIVLSGMSDTVQMDDNISFMRDLVPFGDEEEEAVKQVVREYGRLDLVPCTRCGYCLEGCRAGIAIPSLIEAYNGTMIYSDPSYVRGRYALAVSRSAPPEKCVKCGACERICPQHLPIRGLLEKIAAEFA